MHEGKKIREAKYFYSRMIQEQRNRDDFTYNLSAFLSSARSVLQYALSEAEINPGGQQWYDDHISESPVLKFFKDKRDISIHIEPVEPVAQYRQTFATTLYLSPSLSVIVRDKDGNIKEQYSSDEPEPKPKQPPTPAVTEIRYRFADWSGNEDVLTLCKKYIQELENIIKDGIRRGFISG